jgi:hypothetical protein
MAAQAISSSSLRHVYLVTWCFGEAGGMERHITELAKSLKYRNITVTIFSEMPVPQNNQYRKELQQAGIAFVAPKIPKRIVAWWQQRFPAPTPGQTAPPIASATDLVSRAIGASFLARLLKRTLQRRVMRSPPDVVHVHGWLLRQWVATWCGSRGLPVVYTEHSTLSDWGGPASPRAAEFIAGAGDIA